MFCLLYMYATTLARRDERQHLEAHVLPLRQLVRRFERHAKQGPLRAPLVRPCQRPPHDGLLRRLAAQLVPALSWTPTRASRAGTLHPWVGLQRRARALNAGMCRLGPRTKMVPPEPGWDPQRRAAPPPATSVACQGAPAYMYEPVLRMTNVCLGEK